MHHNTTTEKRTIEKLIHKKKKNPNRFFLKTIIKKKNKKFPHNGKYKKIYSKSVYLTTSFQLFSCEFKENIRHAGI